MAGLGDAMVGDVTEAAHGNTATVKRSTGTKVVERLVAEVADNGGVTVTCSYKTPEGGNTDSPMPYPRDKKHVFEDPASAVDFIATKLGVEPNPAADDGEEAEGDDAGTPPADGPAYSGMTQEDGDGA